MYCGPYDVRSTEADWARQLPGAERGGRDVPLRARGSDAFNEESNDRLQPFATSGAGYQKKAS